ncbi:unnamed protein product, partial [Heterosigma akashiwo]
QDIDILFKGQRFTGHPNMALVCSKVQKRNTETYIANDETLAGDRGEPVRQRIKKALEDQYVGQDKAAILQQAAQNNSLAKNVVVACAACNTIVVEGEKIFTTKKIEEITKDYVLTDDELQELQQLPPEIIANHIEVLNHEGTYYWLNPQLIHQLDHIIICTQCDKAKSIRNANTYSIAAGFRLCNLGNLPSLSDLGIACIAPMRIFNMHFTMDGSRGIAHAISFLSDG